MKHARTIHLLLVDDNLGDVRLTQETLKESQLSHNLEMDVVADGEEALKYLYKQGKYVNAHTPELILLDLNLPRKDGREVLAEIKQNPRLRQIPVIVLTTSDAYTDIFRSYDLHANCFITKPVDISQFIEVFRSIEQFWFNVVKLPSVK
jgi:two-component system, chemotaxis family, response regulator Rcp1